MRAPARVASAPHPTPCAAAEIPAGDRPADRVYWHANEVWS